MRGVLIKFLIVSIFSGSLLVPVFANAEGRVVFEVATPNGGHGVSTKPWGQAFFQPNTLQQNYVPQWNHSLCAVGFSLKTFNSPSGDLILKVMTEIDSETVVLAETSRPGSSIGHNYNNDEVFHLDDCLVLAEGQTYNIRLERTGRDTFPVYEIKIIKKDSHPNIESWLDKDLNGVSGWFPALYKNFPNPATWPYEFSTRLYGYREPVVIIPGILGTRINNAETEEEIWPGGAKLLVAKDEFLDDLILDLDGRTETVSTEEGGIILKEAKDLYGPLIDQFSKYEEGKDLILHPYDWRKDLSSEAMLLAKEIETAASSSITGKVSVVAHSMGGLLAKEYFRQDGDELISQIVLMGSPKLGSPKTFKAINWGDDMDIGKFGLGLNEERVKIITQNMPAVYQLLPSREYLNQNGHGYVQDRRDGSNLKVLDFDAIKAFMLENPEDSRNEALLNLADNFHETLDQFNFPQDKTYNIIACQHPTTIGGFLLYPKGKVEVYFVDGDGTVPTLSGNYQAIGGKSYYALSNHLEVDHTGLVKNSATTALARKIIEREDLVLENGISENFNDCSNGELAKNKVISTHSPVIPHFYDANGNHTGPDENGDIELGIPGSDYFIIGENHFGIMPEGIEFRVEIESTGTGTFDLKIKNLEGTEVVGLSTFIDIPIENVAQTATYHSNGQTLYLDKTGDGESEDDEELDAFVILGQEQANDTDPPTILIAGLEEKEYIFGEIIAGILIEVSDENSGLFSSQVSLNGELFDDIAINTTELGLGDHVFAVEAYDNAGNLALQEINFSVVEDLEPAEQVEEEPAPEPEPEPETEENQEEEPPVEDEENEEEQQEQDDTEEENNEETENNSDTSNNSNGSQEQGGSGSSGGRFTGFNQTGQVLGASTLYSGLTDQELLAQLIKLLHQLIALLQEEILKQQA
ncbi:MAG: hypothetical protein Q8Q32_02385 [bacterium]|nr:hypothetical protein [bacterium]